MGHPVSETEPQPPIELTYQSPRTWSSRWGKGFLAVSGTLVCWGLGHFLVGRRRRAARWFAAWLIVVSVSVVALLVPRWVPALVILLPLQVVLTLAAIVDAFVVGRRAEDVPLHRAWQRYAAGVMLLVVAWGLPRGIGWTVRHWAEAYVIPTAGMAPTVAPGDRVLTHKYFTPRRWDVVAFHPPVRPNELFLMRIAGLPGEKVEIVNGQIVINDVPVAPPDHRTYNGVVPSSSLVGGAGSTGHPVVLGPDEYFVLGDNTTIAYDSRWWNTAAPGHQIGAVPYSSLIARATAIYWPPRHWHLFP